MYGNAKIKDCQIILKNLNKVEEFTLPDIKTFIIIS
jgi:hypothetical protein